MAEIFVKGKNLIKKINKADPNSEYTTYVPRDGELVCVIDGDNAGLVVGDGTSTVDECKSVGGGSSTEKSVFNLDGTSYTYDFDPDLPTQLFCSIGGFLDSFPFTLDESQYDLEQIVPVTPLQPTTITISRTAEGTFYYLSFTQLFIAETDYEEYQTDGVVVECNFHIEYSPDSGFALSEESTMKMNNQSIVPGTDSGWQECFTIPTLTIYKKK